MKQKLTYFRRTRTFVLSLLLLSCMAAQGQQQPSRMVKGLVKDARTGEPLAGVAVLVRGTTQGTTTGISENMRSRSRPVLPNWNFPFSAMWPKFRKSVRLILSM